MVYKILHWQLCPVHHWAHLLTFRLFSGLFTSCSWNVYKDRPPNCHLKKAGFAHFSGSFNRTRYFPKHTLQSPGGSHSPHPLLSTPSNQWLDWLFHKRSSSSISIRILLFMYCVQLCFHFNIMHQIWAVKKKPNKPTIRVLVNTSITLVLVHFPHYTCLGQNHWWPLYAFFIRMF